jgi:hypothetical protein
MASLEYIYRELYNSDHVKEWYYSDGELYSNHKIITNCITGCFIILTNEEQLKAALEDPVFKRTYDEWVGINPEAPNYRLFFKLLYKLS